MLKYEPDSVGQNATVRKPRGEDARHLVPTAGWQRQLGSSLERLYSLGQSLADALRVPMLTFERNEGELRLALRRVERRPSLSRLLQETGISRRATAVLGRDASDRPIIVDLTSRAVGNILVSGVPGSGKTSLLRTLIVSLALRCRQSEVQFCVVDLSDAMGQAGVTRSLLYELDQLPHLVLPLVASIEDTGDVLEFLVTEVEYRLQQGIQMPLLLLAIDDLDALIDMGGRPQFDHLDRLLQDGPEAGLRTILCVEDPLSPAMQRLLRHDFSIRFVGRARNSVHARAAAAVPDTYAEYLSRAGEFIAVAGSAMVPFQSVTVGSHELNLSLERIYAQDRHVLLARPVHVASGTAPGSGDVVNTASNGKMANGTSRAEAQEETDATVPSRVPVADRRLRTSGESASVARNYQGPDTDEDGDSKSTISSPRRARAGRLDRPTGTAEEGSGRKLRDEDFDALLDTASSDWESSDEAADDWEYGDWDEP